MDIISNRINELHIETERLVNERQQLLNRLKGIEARLTQIVGGLTELNSIKELGKVELSNLSSDEKKVAIKNDEI